jgi:methylated-DNA-protein-cysteine methyltransferase related protein
VGAAPPLTRSPRALAVIERVRSVPIGFVATYGDLCPEAPRFAGMVLAACEDPSVPWQRIVRADGSLAVGGRQRRLLEAEDVPFRGARVDMAVAWADPAVLARPSPPARRAAARRRAGRAASSP